MNAKEVVGHITDRLKAVARLRQAGGNLPDISSEARVIQIRKIATALDKLQYIRDAKDDYEAFEKSIWALVDAACDERWDLVKEAADLLTAEYYLPRDCPDRLKEDAKFVAYSLAHIDEPKLGKLEILRVIKEAYPELYREIPTTSKGNMSEWWKQIGGVPRAYGERDNKHERAIESLISRLIKSRKSYFPEFMGPRYDPHWEGKGRFDT
jgi:hypothetical protein